MSGPGRFSDDHTRAAESSPEGAPTLSAEATWLLLALLAGHFLGDFTPLSTARMQEAKAAGGPLAPIAVHAAVHAALVVAVLWAVARPAAGVLAAGAGLEFATHFLLDGGRARLAVLVPSLGDPGRRAFWTLLGFDQMLHGAVLVAIAGLAL